MKIGLLGCGSIGAYIAKTLDSDHIRGMDIAFIYDVDPKKTQQLASKLKNTPRISKSVGDMITGGAELIVEAASQEAVKQHALGILRAQVGLMIMSVGALANKRLLGKIQTEINHGARLYVPSGALCGLDGLKSARIGGIREVSLITTKPAFTLAENEHVKKQGIDLDKTKKKTVVFEGCARDAAKAFPKSINVSVALSLAGVGMEKTRVTIIADPKAKTNTHEVRVAGAFGELTTKTSNKPFPNNPKTSHLAALSAIAMLEEISAGMHVGN